MEVKKIQKWADPGYDDYRKTCLILNKAGENIKPVVEAMISLSADESIKDAMAKYLEVTGRDGSERWCLPVGLLIDEQATSWEFQPVINASTPATE